MQQPFESWSLSSPPVPPRSQLYSLQPVGVGTGLVESLTGYVARLAEAHTVSVGGWARHRRGQGCQSRRAWVPRLQLCDQRRYGPRRHVGRLS
jgi:hypothetical protein